MAIPRTSQIRRERDRSTNLNYHNGSLSGPCAMLHLFASAQPIAGPITRKTLRCHGLYQASKLAYANQNRKSVTFCNVLYHLP